MTRSPGRGVAFSMRRSMSGQLAQAPQGLLISTGCQLCDVARARIVMEGLLLKPSHGCTKGRRLLMEAIPTSTIADERRIAAAVTFNRHREVRIVTHANDFLVFTHGNLQGPGDSLDANGSAFRRQSIFIRHVQRSEHARNGEHGRAMTR